MRHLKRIGLLAAGPCMVAVGVWRSAHYPVRERGMIFLQIEAISIKPHCFWSQRADCWLPALQDVLR